MPKKDQIEQVEVKSDGYKFAVTFLAAIGSILYTMYNYLHNTWSLKHYIILFVY